MKEAANLRVVVVDDEDINLYILERFVRDVGHDVMAFSGGIAAWEYLEQNPHNVDMVILDKMMYDMDGIEVINHMKKHDVLKTIPIIMQSGNAFPDQISAGLASGADLYLVKPYGMQDMVSAMESVTASGTKKRVALPR